MTIDTVAANSCADGTLRRPLVAFDRFDDWIEFVEQRVDHDTDLADRVIDGDLFSALDWVNIANCDQGFLACPRSFHASAEREHRSTRKWLRVCCDTLCAPIKARLAGSR